MLAVNWDYQLSGRQLDHSLARFFQDTVKQQLLKQPSLAEEVKTNPRVYEKLLKEAKRVKEVLSANSHATASV